MKQSSKHQTVSFELLLARNAGISVEEQGGMPAEPLASMEYESEAELRNETFRTFCMQNFLSEPLPLIRAPQPRKYRTTSKRRVFRINNSVRLLSDMDDESGISLLEREDHALLFTHIEKAVAALPGKNADIFNFIIIRGDRELSVIFNIDTMNGKTVKLIEKLTAEISADHKELVSAFILYDPTRSKYYFEGGGSGNLKRLFGPRTLRQRAAGIQYHFHPLAFSQVNIPSAERMLECARDLFSADGGRLLDLYCGYGFFSLYLGRQFNELVGIDYGIEAAESAHSNARHIKGFPRHSYHSGRIDGRTLPSLLPPVHEKEYILLDPPRKGCVPGVISALAQRSPVSVIHIFCGADEIPGELRLWTSNGYAVEKIIPVDMFPGTLSIETMVYLVPEHVRQRGRRR